MASHLFSKYESNPVAMGRNYLGEFEEMVLLIVASFDGEAYGAAITQYIQQKTGRRVVLSGVHIALYRLEEKGLATSLVGGATQERGGRARLALNIREVYRIPIG